MKTYTYSEAQQRLASLLDQAGREGRVQIRRQDGSTFVLQPVVADRSPLDVPGVPLLSLIGIVMLAHSSLDRVLGYGLKYPDSFQRTHLG